MLSRAIILPQKYALSLSEKQGIELKQISLSQLSEVDSKTHFALSFIKDKKINFTLGRYLRPYIEAMIDISKYEYKPADYIISVPSNFFNYIVLSEPELTAYMKDKVKQNQLLSQDR